MNSKRVCSFAGKGRSGAIMCWRVKERESWKKRATEGDAYFCQTSKQNGVNRYAVRQELWKNTCSIHHWLRRKLCGAWSCGRALILRPQAGAKTERLLPLSVRVGIVKIPCPCSETSSVHVHLGFALCAVTVAALRILRSTMGCSYNLQVTCWLWRQSGTRSAEPEPLVAGAGCGSLGYR